MNYKTLGKTGEQLSAIGLGCMGMSFAYGQADEQESIRTLHKALDSGINFWDTADMYANGKMKSLFQRFWYPTEIRYLSQPNSDSVLRIMKPDQAIVLILILMDHRNGLDRQ